MEIRQRNVGPIVFLDLKGRVVIDQEEVIRETVNRQLSMGRRQFALNLEDVTYMDTSGLSTMLAIRLAVDRQGGQLKLLHLPSRVYDLLVITKLVTLFDIVASESDVAGSFSKECV